MFSIEWKLKYFNKKPKLYELNYFSIRYTIPYIPYLI